MDIFENLENLAVSEECFDDIIKIVEAILAEENNFEPAKYKNKWHVYDKTSATYYAAKGGKKGAEKRAKELNTAIPSNPKVDLFYEGLEVSEECFNDIIDETAGTIYKSIEKKYGKPKYDEEGNPVNKSAELGSKFLGARSKEFVDAYTRDYEKGKDLPRGTAGRKECTTHAAWSLRNKRDNTKAQKNEPKYSDEHKDEVLKQKEEMRKKHAEISGGKKGTGGVPYNEFIEKLREISPMANKNHHTKGGKDWK